MNNLRKMLAAAVVAISLAGMSAASAVESGTGTQVRPTRQIANCCIVYFAGRYWCVPC